MELTTKFEIGVFLKHCWKDYNAAAAARRTREVEGGDDVSLCVAQ